MGSVYSVPLVGYKYLSSVIPQMRVRLVEADSTSLSPEFGCSRSGSGTNLHFKQLPGNANVAGASTTL